MDTRIEMGARTGARKGESLGTYEVVVEVDQKT